MRPVCLSHLEPVYLNTDHQSWMPLRNRPFLLYESLDMRPSCQSRKNKEFLVKTWLFHWPALQTWASHSVNVFSHLLNGDNICLETFLGEQILYMKRSPTIPCYTILGILIPFSVSFILCLLILYYSYISFHHSTNPYNLSQGAILSCLLSCFSWVWLCVTVACQAPLSMGFSRQEYWSGLSFRSPGESSWPRDRIHVSYVSCNGRWVLYLRLAPPRRRQWHPTPVLLPGKSHGWRSLVGCSPWDHEESDTTEQLHFHFSLSRIGEGNGNPLQCSCLENPRDRGAWWAAVYGVAQNQTRLKQLSSNSAT